MVKVASNLRHDCAYFTRWSQGASWSKRRQMSRAVISEDLGAIAAGLVWTLSLYINGFKGWSSRIPYKLASGTGGGRTTVSTEGQTTAPSSPRNSIFGEIYRRRALDSTQTASSAPGLKALLAVIGGKEPEACEGSGTSERNPEAEAIGARIQKYLLSSKTIISYDYKASTGQARRAIALLAAATANVPMGLNVATEDKDIAEANTSPRYSIDEDVNVTITSSPSTEYDDASTDSAASATDGGGSGSSGSGMSCSSSSNDCSGGSSTDDARAVCDVATFELLSNQVFNDEEDEETPGVAGPSFHLQNHQAYGVWLRSRHQGTNDINQNHSSLFASDVDVLSQQRMSSVFAHSTATTDTMSPADARSSNSRSSSGGSSNSHPFAEQQTWGPMPSAESQLTQTSASTTASFALAAAIAHNRSFGGAVASQRPLSPVHGFDSCRVRCNISFIPEGVDDEEEEGELADGDGDGEPVPMQVDSAVLAASTPMPTAECRTEAEAPQPWTACTSCMGDKISAEGSGGGCCTERPDCRRSRDQLTATVAATAVSRTVRFGGIGSDRTTSSCNVVVVSNNNANADIDGVGLSAYATDSSTGGSSSAGGNVRACSSTTEQCGVGVGDGDRGLMRSKGAEGTDMVMGREGSPSSGDPAPAPAPTTPPLDQRPLPLCSSSSAAPSFQCTSDAVTSAAAASTSTPSSEAADVVYDKSGMYDKSYETNCSACSPDPTPLVRRSLTCQFAAVGTADPSASTTINCSLRHACPDVPYPLSSYAPSTPASGCPSANSANKANVAHNAVGADVRTRLHGRKSSTVSLPCARPFHDCSPQQPAAESTAAGPVTGSLCPPPEISKSPRFALPYIDRHHNHHRISAATSVAPPCSRGSSISGAGGKDKDDDSTCTALVRQRRNNIRQQQHHHHHHHRHAQIHQPLSSCSQSHSPFATLKACAAANTPDPLAAAKYGSMGLCRRRQAHEQLSQQVSSSSLYGSTDCTGSPRTPGYLRPTVSSAAKSLTSHHRVNGGLTPRSERSYT